MARNIASQEVANLRSSGEEITNESTPTRGNLPDNDIPKTLEELRRELETMNDEYNEIRHSNKKLYEDMKAEKKARIESEEQVKYLTEALEAEMKVWERQKELIENQLKHARDETESLERTRIERANATEQNNIQAEAIINKIEQIRVQRKALTEKQDKTNKDLEETWKKVINDKTAKGAETVEEIEEDEKESDEELEQYRQECKSFRDMNSHEKRNFLKKNFGIENLESIFLKTQTKAATNHAPTNDQSQKNLEPRTEKQHIRNHQKKDERSQHGSERGDETVNLKQERFRKTFGANPKDSLQDFLTYVDKKS